MNTYTEVSRENLTVLSDREVANLLIPVSVREAWEACIDQADAAVISGLDLARVESMYALLDDAMEA